MQLILDGSEHPNVLALTGQYISALATLRGGQQPSLPFPVVTPGAAIAQAEMLAPTPACAAPMIIPEQSEAPKRGRPRKAATEPSPATGEAQVEAPVQAEQQAPVEAPTQAAEPEPEPAKKSQAELQAALTPVVQAHGVPKARAFMSKEFNATSLMAGDKPLKAEDHEKFVERCAVIAALPKDDAYLAGLVA